MAVPCASTASSGLKLEGPQKSGDPRGSVPPSFCFQACRSQTAQAPLQPASFQSPPSSPWPPAGMKAVHLAWCLAVCCVCVSLLGVIKPAASRSVCGNGPARGGRDGLGVAGSGIGRRGWHYRAFAPGLCSTAVVPLSFAINVTTSVLFPISPSAASQ